MTANEGSRNSGAYGLVCSTDQPAVHDIERAQKLSMLSSSELIAGVLIICDHQKSENGYVS